MAIRFPGVKYRNQWLELSGVNLNEVAEKLGTPCYVYSANLLSKNYLELSKALAGQEHLICYAVKANSNLAVLKTLSQLGCGAEVVSGGELFRALKADFPPEKIIFDGVGKTKEEIDYAIKKKILYFNVESEQELVMVDCIAKAHKKVALVSFRINPDVNPKTHPYIATGLKRSKFGIPFKKAPALVRSALRLKNVHLTGLGCHIGSQITTLGPYIESVRRILHLYDKLKNLTDEITHLNLGGGLGIQYKNEKPPSLASWAQTITKEIGDRNVTLMLEPGRSLVGNTGTLLTRVNFVKRGESDNFIITDAGMNDLIRPALYEAYHHVFPVRQKRYKKLKASIVGPVCESGDVLAPSRHIQNFQQGDLLSFMSCGAYSAVMASQYNSRPRAPEVLIKDGKFYTVRERETYEDLIELEKIPPGVRRANPNLSVIGAS